MKWLNDIETYIYRSEDQLDKKDKWVVSDWRCNAEFFATKADAIAYVRENKKEFIEEYKLYTGEIGRCQECLNIFKQLWDAYYCEDCFEENALEEHLTKDRWLYNYGEESEDTPEGTFFYGNEKELEDYLETYKEKYDTKKENLIFKEGTDE